MTHGLFVSQQFRQAFRQDQAQDCNCCVIFLNILCVEKYIGLRRETIELSV